MNLTVVIANTSFYAQRGDIKIELTSPSGTISTVLGLRPNDSFYEVYEEASGYFESMPDFDSDNYLGYYAWPFMSVMFWGENPTGEWQLTVSSNSRFTDAEVSGVEVHFYGVSTIPEAVVNIPEECHPNCVRGCAKAGSEFCDACINLRNAYTLECIEACPAGYTAHNGYCYNPDLPVEECNSPLNVKEEG